MTVQHKTEPRSFRVPTGLNAKLKHAAARKHTSDTAILIEALEQYFSYPKPELVFSYGAFLAASTLFAKVANEDIGTVRKALTEQARRELSEVALDDIHEAGKGRKKS